MSNPTPTPKILLLSSAEFPETMVFNDNFTSSLQQRLGDACQIEWRNYHDIGLHIETGDLDAFTVSDDQALQDFKAVYFKSYFRYAEQAAAITEALEAHHTRFIGHELRSYLPLSKLTQLARMARAGLPIAETIYLPTQHYVAWYERLQEQLGTPFIFKAIDGSTGQDNFLVKSKEQLEQIITASPERHYIAQHFIANDSDLRVLIVGGKVRLVIERRRKDDTTHLNNTSQGAEATLIALDKLLPEHHEVCLRAAQLMNREVAGVDLMFEKHTGNPYILEVNASPQIATGAFEEEKLQVYSDFFRKLAEDNSER